MKLAIINDFVPIQRRPFLGTDWWRVIDVSFGKRNMGGYIVYAQLILFSYGFQLRSR